MLTSAELADLLTLEAIEVNIFRGQSYRTPWKRVFGGQVLAQALHAAYRTVPEDRIMHSMHGYFLLTGNIDLPIVYQVARTRDGGSFSTRRVAAIQDGKTIFILAASFQKSQPGLEHQIEMPSVPGPEGLVSDDEIMEELKTTDPAFHAVISHPRPIEFRPVERLDQMEQKAYPPYRHVWMRAKTPVTDNQAMQQQMLAYASDYNLLMTAFLPHQMQGPSKHFFFASLDHAMWFHREVSLNDWLLYAMDSPSASNTRGLSRGNIFTQDGKLVASVVQEGLIRPFRKG
ncbi:MAG: acyl-CoA thioesterase II [Bacteroidota bacterium]